MKLGCILESADKDGGWAVSEMFCLTLPQFSSYHVVLKLCPSFRYVIVKSIFVTVFTIKRPKGASEVKTVNKYTLNSLVSDLFCDIERM